MAKLPRSFYTRSPLIVAPQLLGKVLVRIVNGHRLSGRIVEVEAYYGKRDPASHAYRGRTDRNAVMFGEGGSLYVYFTYGMHFCSNVVTGRTGTASAVLLRAIEPLEGIGIMKRNRGFREDDGRRFHDLTSGPARICQALQIARGDNGVDLLGSEIYIEDSPDPARFRIRRSTRIGINVAKEKLWRFSVEGNPWVSKQPRRDSR